MVGYMILNTLHKLHELNVFGQTFGNCFGELHAFTLQSYLLICNYHTLYGSICLVISFCKV